MLSNAKSVDKIEGLHQRRLLYSDYMYSYEKWKILKKGKGTIWIYAKSDNYVPKFRKLSIKFHNLWTISLNFQLFKENERLVQERCKDVFQVTLG